MSPPLKMISPIGSSGSLKSARRFSNQGLSFIEVMVTVAVLSFGLVMILKVYMVSLDRMAHLTNRVYATTLLDNRISLMQKALTSKNVLPLEFDEIESVRAGSKDLDFSRALRISEVEDYSDIFQVDLSFSWKEGPYTKTLSRSAYLSDFDFSRN